MIKTYYNLTKPGIIYGNVLNASAGFFLASKWHFPFYLLPATLGGIALVIASACVFNNYLDRNIDAKMARTKKRALVTGSISIQKALGFASLLGISGFVILANYTNALTVWLGAAAFFNYIVLYGVAKRHSVHGTLVGSIAGALPPLAGYTAVTNSLDTGAWLVFLIYTLWQMPHFYSIAIYRFNDYKAACLPVLPVKKSVAAAKLQIVIYIFAFIMAAVALTVYDVTGYAFALVVTGLGLYWLMKAWAGFTAKNDTKWAAGLFGFSLIVILGLDIMLSVGSVLP